MAIPTIGMTLVGKVHRSSIVGWVHATSGGKFLAKPYRKGFESTERIHAVTDNLALAYITLYRGGGEEARIIKLQRHPVPTRPMQVTVDTRIEITHET